jgi:hypothetical protein
MLVDMSNALLATLLRRAAAPALAFTAPASTPLPVLLLLRCCTCLCDEAGFNSTLASSPSSSALTGVSNVESDSKSDSENDDILL